MRGSTGWGEVGIRNWGGAITQAIHQLSEIVIGQDPWSTEKLWQHMFRGGFFPADKVYCCAISAIDIALWDIKGKSVGMPVYKLLGGPVRDKVVCYPHTQGSTNEELVENSVRAVEEGWKFVRWGQPETGGVFEFSDPSNPLGNPGVIEPVESMRIAEQQMAMVREAVGPDIQLCFDMHTRLDTAHAGRHVPRAGAVQAVLHRGSVAVGESGELPDAGAARVAAHRGRRAVGVQMALPGGDRGGANQLRAHRPVHRRRSD